MLAFAMEVGVRLLDALRDKHFDRWLPGYTRHLLERAAGGARRRATHDGPRHLLFALCDHFEPFWRGTDEERGTQRVAAWHEGYPRLATQYRDADGRNPRHSFFFPGEEYRPRFLDALADLAKQGFGEVEVHLHHDGDTEATLEEKLEKTLHDLSQHGHISRDADGAFRWAFIHGNWALANPRTDGRMCGVDAELPLLHRLGCYADYTFPSAPDESQPNIVNQIYWPSGDLRAKRCYERGERARVGIVRRDRLLLVQGPLALAVVTKRGRVPIRIENAALTGRDPATSARARTWTKQNIHVDARPEWVFVKLHTHGAPEREAESLLGDGGHALHRILTTEYNDGARWILHYVTAREMFNIAIAAMDGQSGDPNAYRDYVVPPPPVAQA